MENKVEVLLPQKTGKVAEIEIAVEKMITTAENTKIDSIESMNDAINFASFKIKQGKKQLKEMKDFFLIPVNEHAKNIREFFKSFETKIENAELKIKAKILDFQREIRRQEEERIRKIREEEAKKAREEAEKARQDQLDACEKNNEQELIEKEIAEKKAEEEAQKIESKKIETQKTFRSETGAKTTVKKTWDFEITDFHKLPDDYKLPDNTKIRKIVMALKKEGECIPGIKAFQKESLSL